jgi:hypothetical protein
LVALLATIGIYFVFAEPINHYFFLTGNEATMKKLMEPEQLKAVRMSIDSYFGNTGRNYSLQDLFVWEGHKLSFVQGAFPWLGFGRPAADPKDIMNSGLGKCGEYAILYTAACLSVGIEARLAVVTKSDYSDTPHALCMVNVNGTWTQLDPSCHTPVKLVFNDTAPYQTWYWGPRLGRDYSVFAFDVNNAYNVTSYFL